MITITIDDTRLEVAEGRSLLESARDHGFRIPSLCYHAALRPSGACRLCAVGVHGRSGRETVMLACVLKPEEGMAIATASEAVVKARRQAFLRLLQMAPQAHAIRDLAEAHGIDLGPRPDGCIRCRLCVRVCKEIVGPGALKMEKRAGYNYVVPVEGRCIGCGTCANICPTKAIDVEDVGQVRTIRIRNEVIGRHPLERCEGCGTLFATFRFLDHVEKRVDPHPHLKEHHRYCPTCAKLFSDRIRTVQSH